MAASLRGRICKLWGVASQVVGGLRSTQLQTRQVSHLVSGLTKLQLGPRLQSGLNWTQLVHNTSFSTISSQPGLPQCRLLKNVGSCMSVIPCRTNITYSLNRGKRKSVKSVTQRFLRLDWGIWIRTKAGRHKRMWKKSAERKYRLRRHVFCNKQQSKLFDKMVTDFWKRPKHYVDSPYEIYQKRTNMQKFFPERPPFLP